MIQGEVNAYYEAVVRLTVQGPSGRSQEIKTVIDTGFTGFLALPTALATELSLAYRDQNRVILADGSEAILDVYDVAVVWDGRLRNTTASAADTVPLVGMRLLDQHVLNVEVVAGGRVVIQAVE